MSEPSKSLLDALRSARRCWYSGNGITAYYEQPDFGVPGAFYVNGKLVTNLIVDPEGVYRDHPSPGVQKIIAEKNVSLETGWTCKEETVGSLQSALDQSPTHAACHQQDMVVQVKGEQVTLFVNRTRLWHGPFHSLHLVLGEQGVSPRKGWLPCHAIIEQGSESILTLPVLLTSKGEIPRSCYGGKILIPIERRPASTSNRVIAGLTVELLQSMVPHIPGLQGCRCRIDYKACNFQILSQKAPCESTPQPEVGILWFSTDKPHFPPGTPAQVVAEFIQLGSLVGLDGRAMLLDVSQKGHAETIALLESDWKQPKGDLAQEKEY